MDLSNKLNQEINAVHISTKKEEQFDRNAVETIKPIKTYYTDNTNSYHQC